MQAQARFPLNRDHSSPPYSLNRPVIDILRFETDVTADQSCFSAIKAVPASEPAVVETDPKLDPSAKVLAMEPASTEKIYWPGNDYY